MSPGGALQLAAITAFTLAVIALSLSYDVGATVLFAGAAAAFLVTIVLQRRR